MIRPFKDSWYTTTLLPPEVPANAVGGERLWLPTRLPIAVTAIVLVAPRVANLVTLAIGKPLWRAIAGREVALAVPCGRNNTVG